MLRGARGEGVKQWALKAMAEVSARDHSLMVARMQVRAFVLREAAYRTVDDDTYESVRASMLALDEALKKIEEARNLVWANRFAVACPE
jgi:hypothetical protein